MLALLAPFVLATAPASDVIVVDDDSAPPAEFASIQAAIDAAPSGATILVRPGVYEAFEIDAKSLSIVGIEEGGERPLIFGPLSGVVRVHDVAATQQVVVRGIDLSQRVELEDNAGAVMFEDVVGKVALYVNLCSDVLLARCSFEPTGATAVVVYSSNLHAWEVVARGGADGHAFYANASTLFLSGCVGEGGDGSAGASSPFTFFCDGGDGGDGVHLVSSTCHALDNDLSGGGGGPAGYSELVSCHGGSSGSSVDGAGFTALPGVAHGLEITSPGFEGGSIHLRAQGAPGLFAYALFAPALAPQWFPAWNGTLAIGLGAPPLFLGVLPASGAIDADFGVGDLPLGIEGARLALQAVFVDASGPDYVGSPTAVELLDELTLLADCNGNGIADADDIASGFSLDDNGNGQPDECDVTLIVPDQFPTIQAAVDAANNKDIVMVRDGVYTGPGNHDIQLGAKDLIIRSENGPAFTRLRGPAPIFRLSGGQPKTARIQGFAFPAITGEEPVVDVDDSSGAIVDCVFSSCAGVGAIHVEAPGPAPRTFDVRRCVFRGGVSSSNGTAIRAGHFYSPALTLGVEGCVFDGNTSAGGGAIFLGSVKAGIRNSVFTGNQGGQGSAVMYTATGFLTPLSITGSTFFGNHSTGNSGLFYLLSTGAPQTCTIRNSILWGNTTASGPLKLSANNVAVNAGWSTLQAWPVGYPGVTSGGGILTQDPLFVDPAGGDLHLTPGSPCRDAGEPAFVPFDGELDIDGEPRLAGPAVDQGADEIP